MEPNQYADPLEEALSAGAQRVAQLASLAAAAAQVVMQRRALRDARQAIGDDQHAARFLREQDRIADQQARLSWAPAHDPAWLAHADLGQAGRAWASAVTHAGAEPAAASAMRKCEDRLRALHPFAMARYDRLRDEGMDPLGAMRDAAPMFARSPTVRVGEPAPARLALTPSTGNDIHPPAGPVPDDPAAPAVGMSPPELAETRGQEIAGRLQARARAAGRPPLGPDELIVVLETVTNLPDEMITAVARRIAATPACQTVDRSPAQLAADSFPYTAADAVRAATPKAPAVDNPGPVSTANAARVARRPTRPL